MGSLLFQKKRKDPLVVTSLGFFKPLRFQDAARLLTTVVGLSELLRFRRLYIHGGLACGWGQRFLQQGDHLEAEIKADPRLQWEEKTCCSEQKQGLHSQLPRSLPLVIQIKTPWPVICSSSLLMIIKMPLLGHLIERLVFYKFWSRFLVLPRRYLSSKTEKDGVSDAVCSERTVFASFVLVFMFLVQFWQSGNCQRQNSCWVQRRK